MNTRVATTKSEATSPAVLPKQDTDQAFPSVLVTGTLGAIINVAGVWLTAVQFARTKQ